MAGVIIIRPPIDSTVYKPIGPPFVILQGSYALNVFPPDIFLLEGDQQTGRDGFLLEGDQQSGTDRFKPEGSY